MTDQIWVCSAPRQSAWAEEEREVSPASDRVGAAAAKMCTHALRAQTATSVVVDSALVVLVLDVVVVVVVGVLWYGCEQAAVQWATAVLGRVGRPRGRYYTTCANPFPNNQEKGGRYYYTQPSNQLCKPIR